MGHREDLRERWARWSARHENGAPVLPDSTVMDVVRRLEALEKPSPHEVKRLIHRVAGPSVSKVDVLRGYRSLVARGVLTASPRVLGALCLKPVRTSSGVAPVAVMTKPHPCPGSCVFCPDVEGMPKSYITDEPGALRGLQLGFDPYDQTVHRIRSLSTIGHATDKIELIVLGGTWSSYPRDYQEWFIRRCFDGMNGHDAHWLEEAHRLNETAKHRNVGLSIETRPDLVTVEEAAWLRRLGVTKVQIGIQSLDDRILALNRRGHTGEDARRACGILRAAGFKIHAHWMPNLLGATPESDLEDFARLWDDRGVRPDELKIYPCAVVPGTELYRRFVRGEYAPYPDDVLVDLLVRCKALVPPYCRVTRLMRDIPVHHITAGCKNTNLRQTVRRSMARRGLRCGCIRCREVGWAEVDPSTFELHDLVYETQTSTEHFLSIQCPSSGEGRRLAAFLRLSLPNGVALSSRIVPPELVGSAVIREVHVYGPALSLGTRSLHAQHRGFGTRLLDEARRIASSAGFARLSVIAAVGTRAYYESRGFSRGDLYMHAPLRETRRPDRSRALPSKARGGVLRGAASRSVPGGGP